MRTWGCYPERQSKGIVTMSAWDGSALSVGRGMDPRCLPAVEQLAPDVMQ